MMEEHWRPASERPRIDRATVVLEMPLAEFADYLLRMPLTKEIGERQGQTGASEASASFRTRDEQEMRRVIDESGIAAETVLQPAQGMNKVSVRSRLRGIPIRVGREAAME